MVSLETIKHDGFLCMPGEDSSLVRKTLDGSLLQTLLISSNDTWLIKSIVAQKSPAVTNHPLGLPSLDISFQCLQGISVFFFFHAFYILPQTSSHSDVKREICCSSNNKVSVVTHVHFCLQGLLYPCDYHNLYRCVYVIK